jgi:hypothetical protein
VKGRRDRQSAKYESALLYTEFENQTPRAANYVSTLLNKPESYDLLKSKMVLDATTAHAILWLGLNWSTRVQWPNRAIFFVVCLARNSIIRVLPSGSICPNAEPTDLFELSQMTTNGQSFKLLNRVYARTVSLVTLHYSENVKKITSITLQS